jgi:hypothetical protein
MGLVGEPMRKEPLPAILALTFRATLLGMLGSSALLGIFSVPLMVNPARPFGKLD